MNNQDYDEVEIINESEYEDEILLSEAKNDLQIFFNEKYELNNFPYLEYCTLNVLIKVKDYISELELDDETVKKDEILAILSSKIEQFENGSQLDQNNPLMAFIHNEENIVSINDDILDNVKGELDHNFMIEEDGENRKRGRWNDFSDAEYEERILQISDTHRQNIQLNEEGDNTIGLNTSFSVLSCMWERLYEFQREGVRWMQNHYLFQKGCILADDMGLGKTVQIACHLDGIFNSVANRGIGKCSFLVAKDESLPHSPINPKILKKDVRTSHIQNFNRKR